MSACLSYATHRWNRIVLDVSKHSRLWWAVSSPLTVAAICLVLALLVHRLRVEAIAQLIHQIDDGTDSEAAVAVRRLASMPHPPLAELATASRSLRRPVALEAQQALNDLMRQWQRQLNAGQGRRNVANQVTELTAALAQEQDDFSRRNQHWLANTARKLMHFTDELAARLPPSVAAQCQAVLASTESTAERNSTPAMASRGSLPSPDVAPVK
jgi:hypothetical protein